MAATTEQRMRADDALCDLLESGESPEQVREFVEECIENWQADTDE